MKTITLHSDSKTTTTCVSNAFIDNFMADANGEFVKIYLYLLRCMSSGDDVSISRLADKFEHTEKDITRALKYWEKTELLRLNYDVNNQLQEICLLDSDPQAAKPVATVTKVAPAAAISGALQPVAAATPEVIVPARPEYTQDDLMTFQQKEPVQDLMFIAEKYLGRTLNSADINAILYWHDSLEFSIDLVEYLIEYCVDKGHKNIRYMDKVAISWATAGIKTVEQAKKAAGVHSQSYYTVMKAFGISGRNLVEFELNFIEKWTNTYGFSLDIIGEACKRTIQAIHQPSFEYADTILGNWNKNHVHHLEDIAVLDSAYQKNKANGSATKASTAKNTVAKNRFTNYPQRTYDYTELEKQLLNSSMQ